MGAALALVQGTSQKIKEFKEHFQELFERQVAVYPRSEGQSIPAFQNYRKQVCKWQSSSVFQWK